MGRKYFLFSLGVKKRGQAFILIFFSVLLVFVSFSQSQGKYPLLIDKRYSSTVGAVNLISLHHGIYGLENKVLKTAWQRESTFGQKLLGITYRLNKTILLDNVIDHMCFLIQHEVFGHGSRYREFGYTENRYELNLLFPYGDSSGYASRGRPEPDRLTTVDEHIGMIIGGSEANTLLSNFLRYKWIQRGSINYRETILYLFAANDLSSYILRTRHKIRDSSGNDILSFLRAINTYEGYPEEEDYKLTLDDLARHSLITLFNPFQYFSLYTYLFTYLWSGKENFEVPMINVWGVKFLPSFRMGLTPFGTEFYFENFIQKSDKTINLFFRLGDPTFHKSWGLGLDVFNLVQTQRVSVQARLDIWKQPSILLGGKEITVSRGGLGGAFLGIAHFKMPAKDSNIHLVVQIGYKTAGFLEGEKISKGLIARGGVSFLGF